MKMKPSKNSMIIMVAAVLLLSASASAQDTRNARKDAGAPYNACG